MQTRFSHNCPGGIEAEEEVKHQDQRTDRFHRAIRIGAILVISFCLTIFHPVTKAEEATATDPLPSALRTVGGAQWKAVSPTVTLERSEWKILPDSELRAEYGLERLFSRHYAPAAGAGGKRRLTVEIFAFRHPEGAFGLLTANRILRAGKSPGNVDREEFHHGNYLVSLSSSDSGIVRQTEIQQSIRTYLGSTGNAPPVLIAHLPASGRVENSELYGAGSRALSLDPVFASLAGILDFTGLPEIAAANYVNGSGRLRLLIVEYFTPQSAADNLVTAQKDLESRSPSEQQGIIIRRIGNYLAIAANVSDRAGAESLLNQVRYEQKVYWAGRKLSDIPYEFRPPDPAAIRESIKTGTIIVQSLMLVGLMLLLTLLIGVLVGGVFFYWRRYRRRQMGIDNLFSDAGGTILLKLDDHLLTANPGAPRQIDTSDPHAEKSDPPQHHDK